MDAPKFSPDFERLYCDPEIFSDFSDFHPVSFGRVLPFRAEDRAMDDRRLLIAEEAHLAEQNDRTRTEVIDAYQRCVLLPAEEANNLKSVIDFYDTNFFELMGEIYANAGMFIPALRWQRELIQILENQAGPPSDEVDVYADVGYCLYSLGLFPEAILWSKSCLGPRQTADMVSRQLLRYELSSSGGALLAVERSGPRIRYTSSTKRMSDPAGTVLKLKAAMDTFAPFQEVYLDFVTSETTAPEAKPDGYPFALELGGGCLIRHKMNLIFATCAQSDSLVEQLLASESNRLLWEALMLEPAAGILSERLK